MKKIIQQAFFQLRNQPLLSVITVLGTALAIALIMVILIVYFIWRHKQVYSMEIWNRSGKITLIPL